MGVEEEEEDYESMPENFSPAAHMLAGSVAGIVEHSTFFPIDTIKTRMQILSAAEISPSASAASNNNSYRLGMAALFSENGSSASSLRGFLSLWKGIGSMLVGAGPAHALHFATYEQVKSFSASQTGNPILSSAFAGGLATLVHDAVMNPFDVIKQRMQVGYASLSSCAGPGTPCLTPIQSPSVNCQTISGETVKVLRYRGMTHCLSHTIRTEGISALYISYPTTLAMSIPFQTIHFGMYELLRSRLHPIITSLSVSSSSSTLPFNPNSYSPTTHIISGAIAGATAAFITTPLDVLKTLLQTRAGSTCPRIRSCQTLWDAVRIVYSREGLRGFYRGVMPRVVYAMPSAGLSWGTYEYCKWMLSGNRYFDYGAADSITATSGGASDGTTSQSLAI